VAWLVEALEDLVAGFFLLAGFLALVPAPEALVADLEELLVDLVEAGAATGVGAVAMAKFSSNVLRKRKECVYHLGALERRQE
jgi:hypothetical protein